MNNNLLLRLEDLVNNPTARIPVVCVWIQVVQCRDNLLMN